MPTQKMVIEVENISKQYSIGRAKHRHDSLKDFLANSIRGLFRRRYNSSESSEVFWALQGVSFQINAGEVVGIIGRNGSGKSTLLKILSRITKPTSGQALINGRVGSLLEVGTGFHMDLTGRENIYLSGTILGMRKNEIDRKFDEIVEFSGVAKFLETPVKRYSSGMYVRLGFAVAAHLQPEILLVDEVLAVGDSQFQKKCLDKVQEVGKEGRTVLFVSHSMPSISRLCSRVILLNDGKLLCDGPSHQIVSSYLHLGLGSSASREWRDGTNAPGGEVARLRAVRVRSEDGQISNAIDIRCSCSLEMEYEILKPDHVFLAGFTVINVEGNTVFVTPDVDPDWRQRRRPAGRYVSTSWIPRNLLAEGTLFVSCFGLTQVPDREQFNVQDVVAFQVIDSLDGNSARGDLVGNLPGVVRPLLKWTTQTTATGTEDEPLI